MRLFRMPPHLRAHPFLRFVWLTSRVVGVVAIMGTIAIVTVLVMEIFVIRAEMRSMKPKFPSFEFSPPPPPPAPAGR